MDEMMYLLFFVQVTAILVSAEVNQSLVFPNHRISLRVSDFSNVEKEEYDFQNTSSEIFENLTDFNVGFPQTSQKKYMFLKTSEPIDSLWINITEFGTELPELKLDNETTNELSNKNSRDCTIQNMTVNLESNNNKGLLSTLKWNYLNHFDPTNVLGEMTQSIIKKQFRDLVCVGIITEEHADISNYLPKTVFRYHMSIENSSEIQDTDTLDVNKLNDVTSAFESLLVESLNAACPLYVVQVSKPKAVVHSIARASRRAQYRLNRQYLFLPVLKDKAIPNEELFFMKEMDYMPDVVIAKIVKDDLSSSHIEEEICGNNRLKVETKFKIELKTHRFKGRVKPTVVLVDVWFPEEGFLYSANIFPDKTRDVEGKELVIVTFYYPPFNVFNMNAEPPLYDGIEFRVATEYLRYVNASFRLTTDPTNYWGDAFENGTGNGVLGTVCMDKADLGFSAFYSWPSSFKVVDFSNTHMRSSVTILTPRPKLKPGYLMPIMPFSGAMWGAVGGCYVGATYFLYMLQKIVNSILVLPNEREMPFSQLGYTALWLYAMLVSQGPDYKSDSRVPSHTPARHFIAWFLVMGEVVCDSYSAGLAYVLSTPRYELPIETIEDLSKRHIIWAGNHPAWIWSIEEDENPDLQAITRNFQVLTEEKMSEIGRMSGDMAFGIERLQGGHFTTESHITVEAVIHRRIMKDTLYWSHLQFLLRKGSPYKKHFNTLVTRLREAGLPLYWEGEVIRLYMSERLQLAISTSRIMNKNENATKLNLDELQGVFFLLVIGYMLGILAFTIELTLSCKQ